MRFQREIIVSLFVCGIDLWQPLKGLVLSGTMNQDGDGGTDSLGQLARLGGGATLKRRPPFQFNCGMSGFNNTKR